MGKRSRRISAPQFKIVYRHCVGESLQLRLVWLLFKPLKNNSHPCPLAIISFFSSVPRSRVSRAVCTASGSNPLQRGLVFPSPERGLNEAGNSDTWNDVSSDLSSPFWCEASAQGAQSRLRHPVHSGHPASTSNALLGRSIVRGPCIHINRHGWNKLFSGKKWKLFALHLLQPAQIS